MEKSLNNSTENKYKRPMRFYRTVVKLLSAPIKAMFLIKIKGSENIPQNSPCFVCCNHLSNWDPVFLAVAMKRPVHFMAKKELFSIPVIRNLLTTLGAFPVDRDNADFTAITTALTHIKYENIVELFSQGTRCIGNVPETIGVKSGTGMLVFKTQADVLPVSIYTKNYKVRLFKKVYITIGKPISYDEYGPVEKSQEEYQRISNTIFGRICGFVKESEEEAQKK